MESHGPPPVHTSFVVTGHVHPPFLGEKVLKDKDESLDDLVTKVKLDVVLRGFANDGFPPVCALVFPQLRRSCPTPETDAVQHLDVVSRWKGLSQSQMHELAMWQRLFEESLASQIEQRLQQGFADWISGYRQDPFNEALLVPRMIEFMMLEDRFRMHVSMTHLVHDMISELYNTHRSDTAHRKFGWSLSSGSLPDFVYNFIRTQDCLLYSTEGPFLLFSVSHSYADGILGVFADVDWHLPRITFSALETRLAKDEMYRIIPHFTDTTLAASCDCGFSSSKGDITYAVLGSSLPLEWDYNRDCFYASVSADSKAQDGVVETTFCAKITTPFHAGITFERNSRYRIKLEVCEDTKPDASQRNDDSFCQKSAESQSQADDDEVPWLDPRLQGSSEPHSCSAAQPSQSPGSPWVPSYTSTPLSKTGHCVQQNFHSKREDSCASDSSYRTRTNSQIKMTSPGKRKAWVSGGSIISSTLRAAVAELERLDNSAEAKRRKLKVHDAMDADSNFAASPHDCHNEWDAYLDTMTTSLLGKPSTSFPPGASACCNRSQNSRDRQAQKSRATDPEHTLPSPPSDTKPPMCLGDFCRSYPDASSSPVDEITPPATASTLSQKQIQHNYQEFEERKRSKDAEKAYYTATVPGFDGVVSPTDLDDKTFESIFLEDASDWEEEDDVDGLSEEMESVCLEG